MKLIIELTKQLHTVARIDDNGKKYFFSNSKSMDIHFSDVSLIQNDLNIMGSTALRYAEKMNIKSQLIYPIHLFLKINNLDSLHQKELQAIKAMGILLRKLKQEAESQFGKRASNIDIYFKKVTPTSIQLDLLKIILSLIDFPEGKIFIDNKYDSETELRNPQYSKLNSIPAIGFRCNDEGKIIWQIEKGACCEKTNISFIKVDVDTKSIDIFVQKNTIEKLISIPIEVDIEMSNLSLELDLTYSLSGQLKIRLINWQNGVILNNQFTLVSPFEQQLLTLQSFFNNL